MPNMIHREYPCSYLSSRDKAVANIEVKSAIVLNNTTNARAATLKRDNAPDVKGVLEGFLGIWPIWTRTLCSAPCLLCV